MTTDKEGIASAETLSGDGAEASRKKKRAWPRRVAIALVAVLALCGAGFAAYVSDYYHADERAESALSAYDAAMPVVESDSSIAVGDSSAEYGVVFYPGAKVAAQAYVPLACALADRGVYCVIAKMPCNLAFFGIDSATALISGAPQVQHWWIAGHSLGGAMAAQYAASNPGKLEGIALLGAYAASDLSATDLRALVIYGSNDGVLNRDKLASNEPNLPADSQTIVIDGGNHAGFGDYGAQAGDGEATISNEAQQQQAAEAIVESMSR